MDFFIFTTVKDGILPYFINYLQSTRLKPLILFIVIEIGDFIMDD